MGRSAADFWQMQPYEIWWLVKSLKKRPGNTDWDQLYSDFKSAKANG